MFCAAAGPQDAGSYGYTMEHFLAWVEYGAVVAVGWSAAVAVWLATVHQAGAFLISNSPRAWRLWRRGVLTSPLPLFKYVVGGVALLVLGAVAAWQLLGFWTEAFDLGLWAGGATGVLWTVRKLQAPGTRLDFLLSNQRYVAEGEGPPSLEETM